MKQSTFKITSVLVVAVLFLAACSPAAMVGQVTGNGSQRVNVTDSQQVANNTAQTAASAVTAGTTQTAQTNTSTTTNAANFSELLAAYQGVLEGIYAQVNPSVVNIHVLESASTQQSNGRGMPLNPNSPGGSGQPVLQGEGSGFIWDTQGNIVTNNHVVNGASAIEVIFSDGTALPAKLVGTDVYSDLAVVKVDAPASLLKPITVADSRQVKVGELAIAIGNPYGLSGTMTTGIVSALGRSLSTDTNSSTFGNTASYQIPDVIQTDAAINPGNSGGALVNAQGQLIGVTAAIESSSNSNAGIGFAIPSSIVQKVVPALIKDGKYEHPYLGISAMDLTAQLAEAMNLKSGQQGALVEEVVANGPAAKAGLLGSTQPATINGQSIPVGGDVIIAVDNQAIHGMDDLIAHLESNTSVGQKIALTVLRAGKEVTLEVTLGARPAQ